MILSDRDLRRLLASGGLIIEPFDEGSVQPSSIDLRVGHQFRVFANNRYPYIDVRRPMDGLTELVEATEEEPFILHPGEFVLGSTLEKVALPDDVVGRLEGKSSMGRLGLLIHSSLPATEPVLFLEDGSLRPRLIGDIVRKRLQGRVVGFDPETFAVDFHEVTGWYEGPPDRIFEVVLASGRRVRVTGGHNLFTLNRAGDLTKVRTHELVPGTRVALPLRIPDPPEPAARLDLLSLAPEAAYPNLVCEGPADRRRLALSVALQVPGFADQLRTDGRLTVPESSHSLPVVIEVDTELAWLLGHYVAQGSRRRTEVVWFSTDQAILDRVARAVARLGLPVGRSEKAITCCSPLLSQVIDWLDARASDRQIPPVVFGWPQRLVHAFLEGVVDGAGSGDPTRRSLWSRSERLIGDLLLLTSRLGRRADSNRRDGDLRWDAVLDVRDTGETESIYDLEVRPGGRRVENFLAGYGGVFVANTAGFVDAGWSGHLTLELSNVANLPITIYPGMKIGQLCLFQMTSPAEHPYGSPELRSKYQGQTGPTPSRYFENFDDRPES